MFKLYSEYSFYALFDILFFLLLGGKVTERGGEGDEGRRREGDRGGGREERRAVLREAA